ncbi:imidazole glycerol phosphate synthase subunit HisH [Bradyrhizobium symbiodeficiens]|uniref:imidazole glycerol phosphate synthase subunit HisH n=1 Tax=Bradyrhizobium symbiodeficiens TaxID=1404367 RepID=UPI00140F535F|nr:imidazole glycerol phosphate synthase subunit HisH [Bradyrhizobium symbiodeficiens]QIP01747.1 imidazole glycerol phosphate synthase subunit HisH [Bradyrhizobium symbiodeficiens]
MTTVAILDYGIGNRRSVSSALSVLGAEPYLAASGQDVDRSDGLIIPGVGAFPHCMAALEAAGFPALIADYVGSGRPVLGICVGMQMLFDVGSEFTLTKGLGIIPGRVDRLAIDPAAGRLPHIAWTSVDVAVRDGSMFEGLPSSAQFYFVHSFAPTAVPNADVSATASYCGHSFVAAVQRANVWGTQFHPEKSGPNGLKLLANFVSHCRIGDRPKRGD